MKKFLAILLVFCVILSIGGCSNDGPDNPHKNDDDDEDDLVTVYLLVSETEYEKNGAKGHYQTTYKYDEMGNLLSSETDRGITEEIWDDDNGVFKHIYGPYDGTIDAWEQYTYDSNGSIINHIAQWIGDKPYHDYTDDSISYQYGQNGQILTVTYHYHLPDGGPSEDTWTVYCRYDDAGNLCRIESSSKFSSEPSLGCKFSYDEKNRLTQAYYYPRECAMRYEYTYNDAGLLAAVGYARGTYSNGYDNKESATYGVWHSVQFEYDEKGCVLTRKFYEHDTLSGTITCEYDSGKLVRAGNYRFSYNDDGTVQCQYEITIDGTSTTREIIYDENGNIIQTVSPYDKTSYVKYKYKSIEVPPKQAERLQRVQYLKNRIDADGCIYGQFQYAPGYEYYCQIPFPVSPLYQIDLLQNIL